jgi:N4-gp56 family major capsid protein
MANFALTSGNEAQKWDSEFFSEYVRYSGFVPYMGEGSNSVIVVKKELASGGKTINIPLIGAATGAGVGTGQLEGNEINLGNFNHPITLDWVRNAVVVSKDQEHYSEFSVREAAKEALDGWARKRLRDDLITALSSVTGVAYGSATEAQRDAWLDTNLDRVLYGAARSNVSQSAPAGGATNDHSASLLNVDGTNDLLTAKAISLMKVIAKTANRAIMPTRVKNAQAQEFYVLFTNSNNFYYLSQDPVMVQANRDARERNLDNPLFQGGDLVWDGVVIKEIPEMPNVGNVGAASVAVAPAYMCGAQALAVAWGQMTKSTLDVRDYGFLNGVGIEEARGVNKVLFGTGATAKQNGVVTGYFACPAF